MKKLEAKSALVKHIAPFLHAIPPTQEHSHLTGKKSIEI
jgi:hypothetical protein